jgi:hypothetical protein
MADAPDIADTSGETPLSLLWQAFRDDVVLAFDSLATSTSPTGTTVRVRSASEAELDSVVQRRDLPLLVVPERPAGGSVQLPVPVVVAVEGRDTAMAREVARVLDPSRSAILLLHATWVPPTAGVAVPPQGIDDPTTVDLLAFEGARDALVGTGTALREAGFDVRAHLRGGRHPATALSTLLAERPASLVVLGLGRHGLGIGRDLWRRHALPILYLDARHG